MGKALKQYSYSTSMQQLLYSYISTPTSGPFGKSYCPLLGSMLLVEARTVIPAQLQLHLLPTRIVLDWPPRSGVSVPECPHCGLARAQFGIRMARDVQIPHDAVTLDHHSPLPSVPSSACSSTGLKKHTDISLNHLPVSPSGAHHGAQASGTTKADPLSATNDTPHGLRPDKPAGGRKALPSQKIAKTTDRAKDQSIAVIESNNITPGNLTTSIRTPPASDQVGDLDEQEGGRRGTVELDSGQNSTLSMSGHHHMGGGPPHAHHHMHPAAASVFPRPGGLPTVHHTVYPPVAAPAPHLEPYRSNTPATYTQTLPSMRTIDAMAHHSSGRPPGSHYSMLVGANSSGPPISPGTPHYPLYGAHGPSSYGYPQDSMNRYTTPHDTRLLANRGPKKEIKRRTKTGCLTCRKRRIKCDEAHPSCNNCKKSKRDCLGYDPIFNARGGSQSNIDIQPAGPGQQPLGDSPLPSTSSISSTSVSPSANTYGVQPVSLHGSYPSSHHNLPQHLPTSIPYDPVTASKFEAAYARQTAQHEPSHRASPPGPLLHNPRPIDPRPFPDHRNLHLRAKKMKIDEIIQTLGPPPSSQPASQSEGMTHEITKVYHEMYASGLSAFFETTFYYFTESGKMTFPKNPTLIDHMSVFLGTLEALKANDHSQIAYSGVLETRIVWELACTADHQSFNSVHRPRNALPVEGDPAEAHFRLQVVNALLCGEYLAENPLTPPYQDPDPHRSRQYDFWHTLAEFVRNRDHTGVHAEGIKAREDNINRMRHLLDGRENRDILYSIAIVRELAPRFDPAYSTTLSPHLDEADPKHRFAVASKFLLDEAQITGGTTNVVRRISDIAARAFVNPGCNIARNPSSQS